MHGYSSFYLGQCLRQTETKWTEWFNYANQSLTIEFPQKCSDILDAYLLKLLFRVFDWHIFSSSVENNEIFEES